MEQLTNVINDQQFGVATTAFADSLGVELPKEERELNPIPMQYKGLFEKESPYMTKNQFIRWAKSNGVGCRYQGSTQTMYIFGKNAAKIADMAKMATYFKIVIQED